MLANIKQVVLDFNIIIALMVLRDFGDIYNTNSDDEIWIDF